MRRPPVFALLLLFFAAVVTACGSDDSSEPTKVVENWSQAINASDDDTAAGLFAPAAVVLKDGRLPPVSTETQAA
jgi:hypothetical protein